MFQSTDLPKFLIPASENILVVFTFAILDTMVVNLTHKPMWIYLDILIDIVELFFIKTAQIHILTHRHPWFANYPGH